MDAQEKMVHAKSGMSEVQIIQPIFDTNLTSTVPPLPTLIDGGMRKQK